MSNTEANTAQSLEYPNTVLSLSDLVHVNEQMTVAREVLDKIRTLDKKALVAGGAPRDWFCGKAAKDIDIFYWLPTYNDHAASLNSNVEQLKALFEGSIELKILGIDTIGAKVFHNIPAAEVVEDYNNYQRNPDILHVFEFEYKGQTIQLISLATRGVNVEDFAYNICQAWWDGVKIEYTELFKVGMDKKILIETGQLYANSEAYKRKMREKFSGFTYIAPRIVKELSCTCSLGARSTVLVQPIVLLP